MQWAAAHLLVQETHGAIRTGSQEAVAVVADSYAGDRGTQAVAELQPHAHVELPYCAIHTARNDLRPAQKDTPSA